MTEQQIETFAQEWRDAWNRHDLDAILEHYSEDVIFNSPFVIRLTGTPDGTLIGIAALRDYFQRALDAYPDLHFGAVTALAGIDSVVLSYRSVGDRLAAEMMRLDASGAVYEVRCHYRSPEA